MFNIVQKAKYFDETCKYIFFYEKVFLLIESYFLKKMRFWYRKAGFS